MTALRPLVLCAGSGAYVQSERSSQLQPIDWPVCPECGGTFLPSPSPYTQVPAHLAPDQTSDDLAEALLGLLRDRYRIRPLGPYAQAPNPPAVPTQAEVLAWRNGRVTVDRAALHALTDRATEARAYTVEHFGRDRDGTYVGHMPAAEFDDAVDAMCSAVPVLLDLLDDAEQALADLLGDSEPVSLHRLGARVEATRVLGRLRGDTTDNNHQGDKT